MQPHIKFILINVGLAEHHADWNYKQVVSPFTRIYLPTRGKAQIHLPEGSFVVEPGYLYIIPAYCLHHYECNDDFSLYYVHLYETEEGDLSIGENFNFQTKIPATPMDEAIIKHLLEQNPTKDLKNYNPKQYNDYATFIHNISSFSHEMLYRQMESEGALKLLISHFVKYAKAKNDTLDTRIAKTLLYIRSNLSRPMEVAELAQRCCISTEYFTRKFTQEIGISPIQYIQNKRIQRAQVQLMLEDIAIKDIAYAVGFNDISYFNRVFKRRVGCTPQEYRQQLFNASQK